MESTHPTNIEDLQATIRSAAENKNQLRILGMDSKRSWASAWGVHGSDINDFCSLDMSGFRGIDLYEPEELVLRAGAGTPIAEIQARLEEQGQEFVFEPPDIAPLYGGASGGGTLGGVVACNLSGSRRVSKGAARDSVLGIEAVSGRGELFRSGGRVMKNVTGYDLPKLLTGSQGTLAAMTRITLKVLPACETSVTLIFSDLAPKAALATMTAALSSPYDVSAAAFVPIAVAVHAPENCNSSRSVTALRLEGARESLMPRVETLRELLAEHGVSSMLQDGDSRSFWSFINNATFFAAPERRENMLWRLFLPPNRAHHVDELAQALGDMPYVLDWGGGLAWLGMPHRKEGLRSLCQRVADFAGAHNGFGILIRAPREFHGVFGGFASLGAAETALMKQVRAAFDPNSILSSL